MADQRISITRLDLVRAMNAAFFHYDSGEQLATEDDIDSVWRHLDGSGWVADSTGDAWLNESYADLGEQWEVNYADHKPSNHPAAGED